MNKQLYDDIILSYYPNRRNLFVIPLFILSGLFSIWVGSAYCLKAEVFSQMLRPLLYVLLFCACCIVCVILFYQSAQQSVHCSTEGIFVQHNRRVQPAFISFQGEYYIYETRNYKGHSYYVFSPTELSKQQARKLATKSSLLLKMNVDHTYVIWDNGSYDVKELIKILNSNGMVIKQY